jgi:glycosyltransferase involved in cell wall biosynthesis
VHAFEPYWKQAGLSYEIEGLSDGLLPRWMTLLLLPRAKTVLLQKKLIRPSEFNRLKARAEKVIYDFDDAVYLNPKVRNRFEHIVRNSDAVFAGNRVLAEAAWPYNRNTVIVPTGLNLDYYRPIPGEKGDSPVIGWIGTRHNLKNLYGLSSVLKKMRGRGTRFRLHYICDGPDPLLNADGWQHVPWSEGSERDSLAGLDIGLMPLTDNEYNRGKCGFKILQYMAMGIPAVASPVGFNQELITHGRDGFLCKDPSEWEKCLQTLIADQGKYGAVRKSALERVKDFDLQRIFTLIRPHLAF